MKNLYKLSYFSFCARYSNPLSTAPTKVLISSLLSSLLNELSLSIIDLSNGILALNTISWSSQCTNTSTPSPLPTTLVALTFRPKLSIKNCSPRLAILSLCFFANSIASFSAGGWKPWPTYFEASISSGTDFVSVLVSFFDSLSIAEHPDSNSVAIKISLVLLNIAHHPFICL